ncbi:beta-glucosidase [Hordeum vulgare]|nr:beta-glucosidase [Hordeum vulgare]
MKNMGSDAYRLSISWSRIFPALNIRVRTSKLIKPCDGGLGIIPYTNLYHYDLPLPVHQQYLGWLSPKIIRGGSDTPDEELGEVLPEALQLGQTLVR